MCYSTACCKIAYTCALLSVNVLVSSAAYIPVQFILRFTNTKLPFWWGAVYRKCGLFSEIYGIYYILYMHYILYTLPVLNTLPVQYTIHSTCTIYCFCTALFFSLQPLSLSSFLFFCDLFFSFLERIDSVVHNDYTPTDQV